MAMFYDKKMLHALSLSEGCMRLFEVNSCFISNINTQSKKKKKIQPISRDGEAAKSKHFL